MRTLFPLSITDGTEGSQGLHSDRCRRLLGVVPQIVHPAIWSIIVASFRFLLRHCGEGGPCLGQCDAHWQCRRICTHRRAVCSCGIQVHLHMHAHLNVSGCGLSHLPTWAADLVLFPAGYVPDMMACIFLGYPILYASMYGRFLLLQASCMVHFLVPPCWPAANAAYRRLLPLPILLSCCACINLAQQLGSAGQC